mmetsp:Transcript_12350/g.31605  ORF Transcript_12350/g.31605 Transcript_12350/m.31605 type:complete len:366 (+) Transcript_12350:115-1212(+)
MRTSVVVSAQQGGCRPRGQGRVCLVRAGPLYVPRQAPASGFPREDRRLYPTPPPPASLVVLPRGDGPPRELPTAAVQRLLDAEGVVAVRAGLSGRWLQEAQQAVSELLEGGRRGVVVGGGAAGDGGPQFRQFTLQGASGASPGLRAVLRHSPAAPLAAAMLQPLPGTATRSAARVAFEADDVFAKEAGAKERTPWHRDLAAPPFSLPGAGPRMLNVWTALEPMPAAVSLRVLAGSHAWAPHQLGGTEQEAWAVAVLGPTWRQEAAAALGLPPSLAPEDADDLVTTFALEQLELAVPAEFEQVMAPVAYALQPGDCVLFHRQAIHGAAGNPMPRPRTALSTRWSTEPCDGRRALTPRYQQDLAAPA